MATRKWERVSDRYYLKPQWRLPMTSVHVEPHYHKYRPVLRTPNGSATTVYTSGRQRAYSLPTAKKRAEGLGAYPSDHIYEAQWATAEWQKAFVCDIAQNHFAMMMKHGREQPAIVDVDALARIVWNQWAIPTEVGVRGALQGLINVRCLDSDYEVDCAHWFAPAQI